MKKHHVLSVILLLLFTISSFGQKKSNQEIAFQIKNIAEIDDYLKELEKDSSFIGCVILSNKDSILYQNGFGYSDIENKIPFSEKTLICICSTGKIFTATTVMKMVQEKKVQLDDYIGKYFPELPYGDSVTIRHLLTHTSGLGYYQANKEYFKNNNCVENVEFLKTQKLRFKPGEQTFYSTSGMILLGALIEKMYDKNYIDIIKQEIIIPFNMDNTLFQNYQEVLNQSENEVALPYKIDDKGEVETRELSNTEKVLIPLSAGGQFSCAKDLFKFDRALYSYQILNEKHLNKMIEKQSKTQWPNTYFGLGFVIENADENIEGAGHGGCDNVYYNHFKKQDMTLIITSIEGYANTKFSKNVFEIAEKIKIILFE
jgi:CubicO group peptidase (beta-lactamase class C family)